MSRLDEAKQFLEMFLEEKELSLKEKMLERIYAEPVKYIEMLFHKLEIAEEALAKIALPVPGSRENELVLYYERIAAETLSRIRE